MASDQPWTIGRLLQWTTDYFKEHGAESPRLDAEVLLADARRCERIDLYTAFEQLASDATRDRFRQLVRRRAAGEPVAYLVGRREFFSLPFVVTPDVLIPRPADGSFPAFPKHGPTFAQAWENYQDRLVAMEIARQQNRPITTTCTGNNIAITCTTQ